MRVAVIGGGLMGSGIAEVCARAGVDVTVVETDERRIDHARASIDKSLDRAARNGKLSPEDRQAAAERLAFTTALEDAAGADAAIEAIVEDERAKREQPLASGDQSVAAHLRPACHCQPRAHHFGAAAQDKRARPTGPDILQPG